MTYVRPHIYKYPQFSIVLPLRVSRSLARQLAGIYYMRTCELSRYVPSNQMVIKKQQLNLWVLWS